MNKKNVLLSISLLFMSSAVLCFSFGETGDEDVVFKVAPSNYNSEPEDSYETSSPLVEVGPSPQELTKQGLQKFHSHYEAHPHVFQIGQRTYKLNYGMQYITPHKLALWEAIDFFFLSWPVNSIKLNLLAEEIAKEGNPIGNKFKHKEGFFAVSVGTFMTYLKYVENDVPKSFVYFFGTKSDPSDTSVRDAIRAMAFQIKEMGRIAVFYNSMGMAKIKGISSVDFLFISLNSGFSFRESSTSNVGKIANLIQAQVKSMKIQAYIHNVTKKDEKFHYQWMNYIADLYKKQKKQKLHFIFGLSGNSFSIRVAMDGVIDYDQNLIDLMGEGMDNFDQGPAVEYYRNLGTVIHPSLDAVIDIGNKAMQMWITQNQRLLNGATDFDVTFGQSGQLSVMFEECDQTATRDVGDSKTSFEQDQGAGRSPKKRGKCPKGRCPNFYY